LITSAGRQVADVVCTSDFHAPISAYGSFHTVVVLGTAYASTAHGIPDCSAGKSQHREPGCGTGERIS